MTKTKDFYFPVEVNITRDWNSEIVDDMHPVISQIWDIKYKAFVALDMREYDEYMNLKWLDRELYMRKKALEIIQK